MDKLPELVQIITHSHGWIIFGEPHALRQEQAKEIIRRSNSHDDLLAACEEYQKAVTLLYQYNPQTEIAVGSIFQLNKAQKLGEAAIAKTKKEGEGC